MSRKSKRKRKIHTGGFGLFRFSTALVLCLATIATLLLLISSWRFNITWEIPINDVLEVSPRTQKILSDTQGRILITCFMDRRHPMHRPITRLLRGFREASRRVAGAELRISYVDPHWDLLRASQLVSQHIHENSVVFERNRKRIVITLDDMLTKRSVLRIQELAAPENPFPLPFLNTTPQELGVFRGERVCAAAIARLALPYDRATVYWLGGHGEASPDNYDTLYGFSDIAREISREGFEVKPLNLPGLKEIPPDGQVLFIAGAKRAFVPSEINLIQRFLLRGGRLLCLLAPNDITGLNTLLTQWGIRIQPKKVISKTNSASHELFCNRFADHVITRDLVNAPAIFGTPFYLEALPDVTIGPDRPKVTPLVFSPQDSWAESTPERHPYRLDSPNDVNGPVTIAVASEWGGNAAKDIAFRPTRLCVFGENEFVMNGILATRANVNRDLFLNALSWLAGTDTGAAASLGGDATLFTGFSQKEWLLAALFSSAIVPLVLFLFFCLLRGSGKRG